MKSRALLTITLALSVSLVSCCMEAENAVLQGRRGGKGRSSVSKYVVGVDVDAELLCVVGG